MSNVRECDWIVGRLRKKALFSGKVFTILASRYSRAEQKREDSQEESFRHPDQESAQFPLNLYSAERLLYCLDILGGEDLRTTQNYRWTVSYSLQRSSRREKKEGTVKKASRQHLELAEAQQTLIIMRQHCLEKELRSSNNAEPSTSGSSKDQRTSRDLFYVLPVARFVPFAMAVWVTNSAARLHSGKTSTVIAKS